MFYLTLAILSINIYHVPTNMNYYLTEDRLAELKADLHRLKTVKRIRVADRLKKAKELGDLSENAEYSEAREEQERIEKRILDLEDTIQNYVVIKKSADKRRIDVGSTVEVSKNGKTLKFFIVGSNEARPDEGKISNESPLGMELIKHTVGDVVSIQAPNGKKVEYKILKIV